MSGEFENLKSMGMKAAGSQVQNFLNGLSFPADKQKIVDFAKSKKAPDTVIQMLNKLPDKQYNVPTEVQQEVQKMA